uniref:Cyanovirin-N domain-containing protein n=1 Tax=Plectus sambesii TaxID=2011161 RepID=A0A914UHM8_9BILA
MSNVRLSLIVGLLIATNQVAQACLSGTLCTSNCCSDITTLITDVSSPIPICSPSTVALGGQYQSGTTVSCSCSTTSTSTATFSGGGSIQTPANQALTLTCTSSAWRNAQSQGTNNLIAITCP